MTGSGSRGAVVILHPDGSPIRSHGQDLAASRGGRVLAASRRPSSGWDASINYAARDSATLGGTVGANAGGIRVCCTA